MEHVQQCKQRAQALCSRQTFPLECEKEQKITIYLRYDNSHLHKHSGCPDDAGNANPVAF